MGKITGKSILITGGAGFIGSHLVDTIIAGRPSQLIVVDNLFLGKKKNLSEAFKKNSSKLIFLYQDASDFKTMEAICYKYDIEVVFNLAVIPLPTSLEKPKWTVDQNILITTTLCQLAKDHAFETLIHFSSSEALGSAKSVPMHEDHLLSPLTPYAASKAACDHIVLSYHETFGIDVAILRPFNNYGPRQNDKAYAGVIPIVIKKVFNGEPIEIHGDGEQTRDFLYVKDTAEAAVTMYKCIETRGRVINIASGKEASVNELVKMVLRIMNAESHPVKHVAPRPADVRRHCGDITKAKKLFGFQPKIALTEGLKSTVDYYLQQFKLG